MSCFIGTGNTALGKASTSTKLNTNLIISRLAYNPPKEISYSLIKKIDTPKDKDTSSEIEIDYKNKTKEIPKIYIQDDLNEVEFHSKLYPKINTMYPNLRISAYIIKKQNKNIYLSMIHIKNTSFPDSKYKIIFSHGSSSDLGTNISFLFTLSMMLKCDVISYDYSGYGCSTGIPSEKASKTDISTIIKFIKNQLSVHFSNMILFGYSIGTIPTINEAANEILGKKILGIILLSPMVYELKNYFNSESEENKKFSSSKEMDTNFEKIKEVVKPVFIAHGKEDELVHINEVEEMGIPIIDLYKWYPKKGNHTNITMLYRAKFYLKTLDFIQFMLSKKEEEDEKRSYFNISRNNSNKSLTAMITKEDKNIMEGINQIRAMVQKNSMDPHNNSDSAIFSRTTDNHTEEGSDELHFSHQNSVHNSNDNSC
ncbi:MAG: hypothetical protein MJ252_15450 [archaeon]|nr:hypothetical protein [archaeon]